MPGNDLDRKSPLIALSRSMSCELPPDLARYFAQHKVRGLREGTFWAEKPCQSSSPPRVTCAARKKACDTWGVGLAEARNESARQVRRGKNSGTLWTEGPLQIGRLN